MWPKNAVLGPNTLLKTSSQDPRGMPILKVYLPASFSSQRSQYRIKPVPPPPWHTHFPGEPISYLPQTCLRILDYILTNG